MTPDEVVRELDEEDQSRHSLAMLTTCPACRRESFDTDLNVCRACGALGARPIDLTVTPAVIAQCVHNVKILLRDLPPGSFQQMLGPYSGTLGPRGERDDAVPFTKETALMMHQAVVGEGIRALRICSASNRRTMWCLVFARDEAGFKAARRMAQRSTPAGVHIAFFPNC